MKEEEMSTETVSASPDSHLLSSRLAAAPARQSSLGAILELAKPRILLSILLTAMAGFAVASLGPIDKVLLLHMSVGILLLGAGVGALNQYFERESDKLMRRTEKRPLPSGRVSATTAKLFGAATSVAGIIYLAIFINILSGLLAIATLVSYLFMYTPLKRRTPMSTVIGAFPGAMPPVIGWVAVTGRITIEPVVLFAIMFLWQFPHFLAIAWMYREDYSRAGIKMLPVIDPDGRATGRQMVINALALVPVSVMPSVLGMAGVVYFFTALALSLFYLYCSYRAAVVRTGQQARRLMQASLIYPPLLFLIMLLD